MLLLPFLLKVLCYPSCSQDIAYYQALSAEQLQTDAAKIQPNAVSSQEMYEPGIESAANAKLDDLQRSWETLKNVVCFHLNVQPNVYNI